VERVSPKTKSKQFRHTFGAGITNNEAEYMIAIEALKLIQSVLETSGESVINTSILIKSDSALVIGQCSLGWKIKVVHLRALNAGLMNLINKFGNVEFEKLSGDVMKSILGH
jgi:ribonuclease HI